MNEDNGEILAALERVVAQMKRKKLNAEQKMLNERNIEIKRLRNNEYWTLQRIGDKFGISRERVRQIVGNTGELAHNMRIKNALNT